MKQMEKFPSNRPMDALLSARSATHLWRHLRTCPQLASFAPHSGRFSSPILASQSILRYCRSTGRWKDGVWFFWYCLSSILRYLPISPQNWDKGHMRTWDHARWECQPRPLPHRTHSFKTGHRPRVESYCIFRIRHRFWLSNMLLCWSWQVTSQEECSFLLSCRHHSRWGWR